MSIGFKGPSGHFSEDYWDYEFSLTLIPCNANIDELLGLGSTAQDFCCSCSVLSVTLSTRTLRHYAPQICGIGQVLKTALTLIGGRPAHGR
jgi:hypothetical protein